MSFSLSRKTCSDNNINFITTAFKIFGRLGAWQFLADMPFRSVSSETLWKLFLALHLDASKLDSVESIQRENSYKENWRDILESMFSFNIS